MPFIESHPIKIHDLVIEQPVPDNTISDIDRYISTREKHEYMYLSDTGIIEGMRNIRILGWRMTPKDTERIAIKYRTRRAKEEGDMLRALGWGSVASILGIKIGYDQREKDLFVHYARKLAIASSEAKLIGCNVTKTDEFDFELEDVLSNPVDNSGILAAYKILDIPFTLTPAIEEKLLRQLRNPDQSLGYKIKLAADMTIITAEKVSIGENGIEIIKAKATNFNTTPPIPVVRNF